MLEKDFDIAFKRPKLNTGIIVVENMKITMSNSIGGKIIKSNQFKNEDQLKRIIEKEFAFKKGEFVMRDIENNEFKITSLKNIYMVIKNCELGD